MTKKIYDILYRKIINSMLTKVSFLNLYKHKRNRIYKYYFSLYKKNIISENLKVNNYIVSL